MAENKSMNKAQKEKDQQDNWASLCFLGVTFLLMFLGYLLVQFLKLLSKLRKNYQNQTWISLN